MRGEPIIFEFPISIGSGLPFGCDPSSALQTVQRRIERTVLHLQEVVGGSLDVLADQVAVTGP